MPRGYDGALYVLPFDHRAPFETRLFGWRPPLSEAQTAEIAGAKQLVYEGFKGALAAGVPKEKAGIPVDEQFGAAILREAAAEGVATACPAEKSGQDEFDFECGGDFTRHIEAFDPSFCKVLVRYNPEGDRALNPRQATRLSRAGGRDRVGCIILGRGEDDRKVREWLATAAGVPGFIGFAVGRTVFWEPLVHWRAQRKTRPVAAAAIARRYREFVHIFETAGCLTARPAEA